MIGAVQLSFEVRGLDPYKLSEASIFERIEVYDALDLCPLQRQAAEDAVLLVLRREYARGSR